MISSSKIVPCFQTLGFDYWFSIFLYELLEACRCDMIVNVFKKLHELMILLVLIFLDFVSYNKGWKEYYSIGYFPLPIMKNYETNKNK